MRIERYWDPLNKAATLVTLTSGIPAILTFVGLPFLATTALAVVSISSLAFALIRSRILHERMERAEQFHELDSKLLQRANALILTFNASNEADRAEMRSVFSESLRNLRELAEELCRCEARISVFTISPDFHATSIFWSTHTSAIGQEREIVLNFKPSSILGRVFEGSHSAATVHIDKSGDYYNLSFGARPAPRTAVVFPIYSAPLTEGYVETWAGFLSLDLTKRVDLPPELTAKLLKYTYLYFLILHAAGISVVKQIAQQGAHGDG